MANCLTSLMCDQSITAHIQDSCDNPMFSGIEQGAIIINKSDIKKVVTDSANPRIITDLILTRNAWELENARNNPFQGTNTQVVVGEYKKTYTRTVELFVPLDGAKVSKDILDPLANGKFVVIMRNSYRNETGDNEYQVYGIDKGLKVTNMVQTKYENNDYWLVTMTEEEVPNSGRWIIHDSYDHVTPTPTMTYDSVNNRYEVTISGNETITEYIYPNEVEANKEDPNNPESGVLYGRYDFSHTDGDGVTQNYIILLSGFDVNNPSTATLGIAYLYSSTEDYLCELVTLGVPEP